METLKRSKRLLAGAVAASAMLFALPAQAIVISGEATGTGLNITFTAGAYPLTVAEASATSPGPVSDSDFSSFNTFSAPLAGQINSIGAQATSNVTQGFSGDRMASGMATAFFGGFRDSGSGNVINYSGTSSVATAMVSGNVNNLTASGSSTFVNANIRIAGVNYVIPNMPSINQLLVDTGSIRVILNEQILTGDTFESLALQTTALRIQLTNATFGGASNVNGDIFLNTATAALVAVPAPASMGLLALGLVGLARRRSKKA